MPTNIPRVRTSFVGREHELAEVTQQLGAARLVTLTGTAGCGKTRLALRVARKASEGYMDGAHWVELAPLADPSLVPQMVAEALHVAEQSDRTALESLLDALHDRQLLLVLDNCEHLVAACAQFVESLLAGTPVTVLATSREPLRVASDRQGD